jgi:hypothetical protein
LRGALYGERRNGFFESVVIMPNLPAFAAYTSQHCVYPGQHGAYIYADVFADCVSELSGNTHRSVRALAFFLRVLNYG